MSKKKLRLEYLDPAELRANPLNWRTHPDGQKQALSDVIEEVGWAGCLLYNERTKNLIDGHARQDLFAGQKVPVLIGSWSAEQEKKILATLDPISAMATGNLEKLNALLRDVATDSDALQLLLGDLAAEYELYQLKQGEEADDPEKEWVGMPECDQDDLSAWKTLKVHFSNAADLAEFAELVGQPIKETTKFIHFPPAEIGKVADKRDVSTP